MYYRVCVALLDVIVLLLPLHFLTDSDSDSAQHTALLIEKSRTVNQHSHTLLLFFADPRLQKLHRGVIFPGFQDLRSMTNMIVLLLERRGAASMVTQNLVLQF